MKWNKIVLVLLIVLLNFGCDQKTKQVAKDTMAHGVEHSYFNDMFRLVYAENPGAFLSLGSDMPDQFRFWFLGIIPTILLFGMLLYTFFSNSMTMMQAMAMSFIIGGGLSNIFDRLMNDGRVIDFMNLGIGSLRTGIFNFADLSIVFGMILFLFFGMKEK